MAVVGPFLAVESKLPFENVVDGVAVIFWLKWCDFFNQFVDQHTQSPQIDALIISSSCEHFGSPVIGGSCQG